MTEISIENQNDKNIDKNSSEENSTDNQTKKQNNDLQPSNKNDTINFIFLRYFFGIFATNIYKRG